MTQRLVSVIIPTYNRFEQVQAGINSVLEQTIPVEVIVVNDCSTDERYRELDEIYKDKPVTVIHLPINMRVKHGVKAAQGLVRNEGLKLVKGEWIAFLDDDDRYIDSDKLMIQIHFMQKYECLMSATNMLINGNTPYFTPKQFPVGIQVEETIYRLKRSDIIPTNYINNSSVVMHRDIIEKTGLFHLVDSEDYNYWLRAMQHTDCIYIHQPLVYYEIASVKHYVYVNPLCDPG